MALWFRFSGVTSVGFLGPDDAMYARHGRFFHGLPLLSASDLGLGSRRPEREEIGRIRGVARGLVEAWNARSADFYPKPTYGHAWLTALAMGAAGETGYAPALVSAVFGWATVLVVFLIGRELFGWEAGVSAAAVMAVSRQALFYSRTGLAEADSVFFLALGFWLYVRCLKRWPGAAGGLAAAGLAFGVASVIHYRWLLVFPLFLALEFPAWKGGLGTRARAATIGLAAYGLPFFLAELPFYGMMLVANAAEIPLVRIPTYLSVLALTYLKSPYYAFPNLPSLYVYPYYWLINDGPIAVGAALAGMAVAFLGGGGALLRFLGVLAFLLLSTNVYVARSFSPALPALAVLGGLGLSAGARWGAGFLRWGNGACLLAVLAVVLAVGMWHSLPLMGCKSGIEQAARFLEAQRARRVIFPDPDLGRTAYKFYGGGFEVLGAASLAEFRKHAENGADWAVSDLAPYNSGGDVMVQWDAIRKHLRANGTPVFSVPSFEGCWMNFILEAPHPDFRSLLRLWRMYGDRAPAPIEIFRLAPQ